MGSGTLRRIFDDLGLMGRRRARIARILLLRHADEVRSLPEEGLRRLILSIVRETSPWEGSFARRDTDG